MFDFFFSADFCSIFVFFFSWKSLQPLTHSLKNVVFFSGPGKKTAFLLTHSILAKNSQNVNFSQKTKTVPLGTAGRA